MGSVKRAVADEEIDKGNVKIAMDVFADFVNIHEIDDRFDLYDIIIDCRKNLFNIKFEECKEALDKLVDAGILKKNGFVRNQFILNKKK